MISIPSDPKWFRLLSTCPQVIPVPNWKQFIARICLCKKINISFVGNENRPRICILSNQELLSKSGSQKNRQVPEMILGWSPFKIVSVSAVLYPRWLPLLKLEISSNGQNCCWSYLPFLYWSYLPKKGSYLPKKGGNSY